MVGRQFFLFSCLLLAFPFSAKADEKLIELVKKVKPAVVLIQTFDKDDKPLGQGSGFFINNKGHIVTNHHVIEGAYRATVKTSSGMEYPVEGVIAKDADADIVKLVVKIPDANTPFLNLSEIVPSEGQDIVVIGNPLGLESSVSTGVVSAVRDIPAFGKILQITAPISPGSSGSPVINSKGEVIGIATLIITSGQNLNFAVPSENILALKETTKTQLLKEYTAKLLYDEGFGKYLEKNWASALSSLQQAVANDPNNFFARFFVGQCLGELGRYTEALEAYNQAIKIDPNSELIHSVMGDTYGKLGRSQDEIESYKQAIRIKPDYADTHYSLGCAYGKLGRYQDAIESYKQAIRIKPDYADAHHNLGCAYGNLGRWQEAIESFKQTIRINPKDAYAHCNLGIAYSQAGDKDSALEEYKILINLDTELELVIKLSNVIFK